MIGWPHLLGMPLDQDEPFAPGLTPVSGFLVVKVLNDEGKVSYLSAATDGLTSVEALGMARWAVLKLECGLAAEFEED